MRNDYNQLQERIVRAVINTRIYDAVQETPLLPAAALSERCKTPLLLKREDLQPTFSVKVRGAYHKMTLLSPAQLKAGVVAASAGNHAQGVAWAARRLGSAATIVMPVHTQPVKADMVRAVGARVVLNGKGLDDAQRHAQQLAAEKSMTFIPPFDDMDVIAGGGTVAAEILRQHPKPLQAIFCAVGGGGLISGIAAYVKALRPDIRVIGVEAEESASMSASLRAGKRVNLPHVGGFAEAVAVRTPGKLPFSIVRHAVDEIITVNNDAICAAIKDIYDDTRTVVEPSGALAVAGARKYARRHKKTLPLVAITCGANMSFDHLRFISERTEVGDEREMLLAVNIPERPGSFKACCDLIGKYNVTELNYRIQDGSREAHVLVGLEVGETEQRKALLKKLRAHHLPAIDLTDDEMSKLHIRYMIGGRMHAENELLYGFEFPDHPGTLRAFLDSLITGGDWNISLFHYRNHGTDIARVLCAIQVPAAEVKKCEAQLRKLGYPFWREDGNRAYRLFLRQGKSDGR